MKVIDVEFCSCDLLLDLTYQDTFEALDRVFVSSCAKLLNADHVQLLLGLRSEEKCLVLSEFHSDKSKYDADGMFLFPITLMCGQNLSLLIESSPEKQKLIQLVQIISAYVNQQEHLSRANKDQLTGLKNRRAFDLEYSRLVLDSEEKSQSNVLAVIDIDHFKQVNDNFGHLIGDEVLLAMANLMKSFFERDNYLYRFGGEEFVILLKHVSLSEAENLLEELRQEIENHRFPQVDQKTISGGYVPISISGGSTLLFERADAALYFAKKNGRNQIVSYEKLIEQNKIEAVDIKEGGFEMF